MCSFTSVNGVKVTLLQVQLIVVLKVFRKAKVTLKTVVSAVLASLEL